jgi:hypothetical protein
VNFGAYGQYLPSEKQFASFIAFGQVGQLKVSILGVKRVWLPNGF